MFIDLKRCLADWELGMCSLHHKGEKVEVFTLDLYQWCSLHHKGEKIEVFTLDLYHQTTAEVVIFRV